MASISSASSMSSMCSMCGVSSVSDLSSMSSLSCMSIVKGKIRAATLITILIVALCTEAMQYNVQVYQDFEEDSQEESAAVAMPFFTPEQIKEANAKLIEAIGNNNFKAAREAIAEGADVNRGFARICTPLDVAIREKQADMVELLLAHNAQITGFSVLWCAAIKPHFFILNKLLSRNINLNIIDQDLGQSVTDEFCSAFSERLRIGR